MWWIPRLHDIELLQAVKKYGFGSWDEVKRDKEFSLFKPLRCEQLKKELKDKEAKSKDKAPVQDDPDKSSTAETPRENSSEASEKEKHYTIDDSEEESEATVPEGKLLEGRLIYIVDQLEKNHVSTSPKVISKHHHHHHHLTANGLFFLSLTLLVGSHLKL